MSSPFNNKTPESYFAGLRRKDSKNALTTCHGVTDRGRACRRALSSPKNSSKFDGAIVITKNADDPAIYFCWQHKEQAEALIQPDDEGSVVSIKGRHSLEDAFRSLGLDDVDEEPEPSASPSPAVSPNVQIPEPAYTVASEIKNLSQNLQNRPLAGGYSYEKPRYKRRGHGQEKNSPPRPRRRKSEEPLPQSSRSSFSLFSCCFGSEPALRDRTKLARDAYQSPRPHQSRPKKANRAKYESAGYVRYTAMDYRPPRDNQPLPRTPPVELRRKEVPSHRKSDSGVALGTGNAIQDVFYPSISGPLEAWPAERTNVNVYRDSSPTPAPRKAYKQSGDPKSDSLLQVSAARPLKARSKSGPDAQQLGRLRGEWPPALPFHATDTMRLTYAKLLTVMSEAPSKTDSPGYIYIFWQSEQEQTDDETSAVASIIAAPKLDRGLERQETILQRRFFQTSANARLPANQRQDKRTIFLKIGRAINVHQRLSQWKKQCEYDISLLRSYPYEGRTPFVKQVPNVMKVERLIHLHLEMLGQRVTKGCRCGTEHREWFEVDATAKSVREIDEIVRRWIRWSEERFR